MQSDNAHLRITIKEPQMFSQLDCLISWTFHCTMQLNHSSSHCSFSGGMALKQRTHYSCWGPSICFPTFHYSIHLFLVLRLVAKSQMFLLSHLPSSEYLFHLKPNKPDGRKKISTLALQLWELKTDTSLPTEKVMPASTTFHVPRCYC